LEALKRDFRVLSYSVHHLPRNLHAARASGAHARLLTKVLSADLLILDDFGLHSFTPQAAQDFYDVVSERYERASLIITSNRAFEEWTEVFDNDLLASAALDRLTHHTHTLTIRGESYRQRQRRKEVSGSTTALPADSQSS
jgi:DNA replication protein DnaC